MSPTSLRNGASYAIAQMDHSGAEAARLHEFEFASYVGPECPLSAADDHRVEKQLTFVDEIGCERNARKFGAPNADVALRLPLELPDRLRFEIPLHMRVAVESAGQRA